MDHTYERGWHRYGFDNMEFTDRAIHGSDVPISLKLALNRGVFKPHISFAVIEPTETEQTIGMHIHRDLPTNTDVEEWYIIIDGKAVMTFSNGDTVDVGPGDMIATYPGTGHSFRATETVHLISITPQMFTSRSPVDEAPEKFAPRIYVSAVNDAMNALRAQCTVCGADWVRPDDDKGSNTLPVWARGHHHA
jgi:mannose-6-phosphate isomerase-like protein (cupin superfamily)